MPLAWQGFNTTCALCVLNRFIVVMNGAYFKHKNVGGVYIYISKPFNFLFSL